MEEFFPSRMLRDIQMSGMTFEALADILAVNPSTLWRLRGALERGVLPDKAVVIAIYWALGYDKPALDRVALRYNAARHVTPLRRKTTEHRSIVKAEQDISTDPLPPLPMRA